MEQELELERKLDKTGKLDLNGIYNNPDPREYYSTLDLLDYSVPQEAQRYFRKILATHRETTGRDATKVVDLGCSYGVNAALLKCGMTLPQLYGLYRDESTAGLDRDALIRRDRGIYETAASPGLEVVGVDCADRALAYAVEASILDDAVAADFESEKPAGRHRQALDSADLIISTGCVGYISERTIARTLDACGDTRPWMAHFVLRMFPYAPIQEMLAARGYVTARGTRPVRQRRFACAQEREQVLDRLADQGIDGSGLEYDGWYYADLYVSRPRCDADLVTAQELVEP
ncbi:MAG: hypothetical protein AB7G34_13020 [Hyphomicrobiales bacterium]